MLFKSLLLLLLFRLQISVTMSKTWIKSGYWYAGSAYPVPDINSALFTHLMCAFAHINASSYELSISSSDEPYFSTFTDTVKRKNPSVITLLSIWTGNEYSLDFFSMVSQAFRRRTFIESSIKTARLYKFQGLDLSGVLPSTTYNMTNMATFLDEWRAAVNSEHRNSGTSMLILTISCHYTPEQDNMTYPIGSIRRNFDWMHVMAYAYYLPSRDNFTAAHAALYDPSSKTNTDYGIKQWIGRGLPSSQMVLGLPYHGYAWTLVNPNDDAIGAAARGLAITPDGSMSYKYIKWYIRSYGGTSVFNSTYVVNYCKIGSFWIGFDDVEAIKTKVSYAKEMGLLGYNVFPVPGDDKWVLSMAAQEEENDRNKRHRFLVIMLPAIAMCILLLGAIAFCWRRRTLISKVRGFMPTSGKAESSNLQAFSFHQVTEATDNFSSENKLGEGGFGPVYKGKLSDGQEIAVKRLSQTSKQGTEEFKNEVTLAARLQHINLVRLLGFCSIREEKMLIYEYMPNKSLDFYLYDPFRRLQLDWEKRVHIIEGITQGLLYLQEYSRLRIIHRDLKAGNILLDNEMKPKISDFGIARIFRKDEDEASTDDIVGTYGYVPPEYVKQGVYSLKYDVYSFGVLLLQIISGKKNLSLFGLEENLNLQAYAYELWKNNNSAEFMDLSLDDTSSTCKLVRCLQVALLCVQENWEDRPSMLDVYSMLKNETEIVPTPKRPAFSMDKEGSKSQEEICSVNIMTISQSIPR